MTRSVSACVPLTNRRAEGMTVDRLGCGRGSIGEGAPRFRFESRPKLWSQNRLTRIDVQRGYQYNACADRDEGGIP